ncbi:MAG: FAD-binding oxidoreductase [Moraxella sp.]|nr:FAD-binding oxidoreductase [Moraxella sp.]
MSIQDSCLWQMISPKTTHYPTLVGEKNVDVCVVGGGYTGLSAAVHLAEFGYRVCVLEANHVGFGGSGRNVGFVNAGTWSSPNALNQCLGQAAGEKLTHALGLAPKLVFDMIDKYQINAQDTRTGNLHMAHNASAEADIDARYAQLTQCGADVEILTGSQCHDYTGSTKINKILLDKRAGTINPFAYVNGLAQAASGLGVDIYENTHATAITRQGTDWHISCPNGAIIAKKVVLATNAYSEGEWLDVQRSFYHVCYYQIASYPLGDVADYILPYKNGAWDTRLALSSIRRDADGRLLLGTVGGQAFKSANFYQKWANLVQQRYFPNLTNLKWQCQWFGKFGFTPNHVMRVFMPADGIVAATAYNGRGITTGTLMGKAFATFIKHDDPSVLPLPFCDLAGNCLNYRHARSTCTEIGLTLYHAGQILRIIA